MEFHPEEAFDRNRGQRAVWKALKRALEPLTGHAYYRIPFYSLGGFYRYEVDVLLVLRDYGVFPLEVKGCGIENISSIEGNVWSMLDWNREEEAPCAQVDEQKFAILDLIRQHPALSSVNVFERVVLPFVERDQWAELGFASLPSTRIVWTADDLEPERIRAWLESVPRKPRLDDDAWAALCGIFQSRPPVPAGDPVKVRFIRYDGRALDADRIRAEIPELDDEQVTWCYIVATGALERLRAKDFHSPLQSVEPDDAERAGPVMVFHKVMRHWVRERKLRRMEERTLLLRAMREMAAVDEHRRSMLEHDVLAWRDVLVHLDEEGLQLDGPLPEDFVDSLVRPSLGPFIQDLQSRFREIVEAHGVGGTYERIVRRFLEDGFRPPNVVVMEGFTRLTGLQRLFVQRCVEQGALLVLVLPYCESQSRGFEAVRSNWDGLWDGADHREIFNRIPPCDRLQWLQSQAFSDQTPPPRPALDDTVTVRIFTHPNSEVSGVLDEIKSALQEQVDPSEMVVVTRDPGTYLPLILEEAEIRGVQEWFHIPPRILMLTPVGRFALGLYESWDGALHLQAAQLESFLSSGILGRRAQETATAFRGLRAQLFELCLRREEWEAALTACGAAANDLGPRSRLPVATVEPADIDLWRVMIGRIESMCQRLSVGGERPVGEHLEILLDELSHLDHLGLRKAERSILAKIREALEEVAHDPAIILSTNEFGEVLVGLANARDEQGEQDYKPGKISVAASESVDGVAVRRVFAIGVDDARVPRPPGSAWPLKEQGLDAHILNERYQFVAMVRGATERLYLSWSQTDGECEQRPSMYLEDLRELLSLEVGASPALPSTESGERAPRSPTPPALEVTREVYGLEELSVFRLCPLRYRLERLDRRARSLELAFHMVSGAAGRWLELILGHLADGATECVSDAEASKQWLQQAMRATEQVVWREFSAFRAFDRQSVWQSVLDSLEAMVKDIAHDGRYRVVIERNDQPLVCNVRVGDGTRRVTADLPFVYVRGQHRYPLLYSDVGQHWLHFGQKAAEEGPVQEREIDGVRVLERQYDAVIWWWNGVRSLLYAQVGTLNVDLEPLSQDIVQTIQQMERGRYPMNPDVHCVWCPVEGICLGVEV